MAATYKPVGWEEVNPIKIALHYSRVHISMLYGVLEHYGDEELVKLNHELEDLLARAMEYCAPYPELANSCYKCSDKKYFEKQETGRGCKQ